jgi:hypothetical protein
MTTAVIDAATCRRLAAILETIDVLSTQPRRDALRELPRDLVARIARSSARTVDLMVIVHACDL